MSKEEIIECLRGFEGKTVLELSEGERGMFYAIMSIADERDRYKNIIDELERYFIDMFNRTQDTKYLDDLQKLKELKGE